jgi:Flp pilus assembly protein TadB
VSGIPAGGLRIAQAALAGAALHSGSAAPRPWTLIAALAAVFVALLTVALLVLRPLRHDDRRTGLMGQIEHYGPGRRPVVAEAHGIAVAVLGLAAWLLQARNADSRLTERLELAGIPRKAAEWALLGACLCVLLAAMLTALTGNAIIAILIGSLVGWLGMRFFLSFRIARRRAAFDNQLPNALQLVAGSLRLGFSLAQALDALVREAAQPTAGEFGRALAEARLGIALDVALDAVANRMNSDDLRWSVMAIRIQRDVGGNLAEVLRNTVDTMRERAYLRRQVRALSAEGRLSAYILVALPIFIGGWLLLTSPSYMHPLYSTPTGLVMLTVTDVLIVLGALWMRKVITVVV